MGSRSFRALILAFPSQMPDVDVRPEEKATALRGCQSQ